MCLRESKFKRLDKTAGHIMKRSCKGREKNLSFKRRKIEQSVELNDNAKFLRDLELLKKDHLTDAIEEDGADVSHDGLLRSFGFGGSNPLEQLGLFMKQDEDDEEEEGEID